MGGFLKHLFAKEEKPIAPEKPRLTKGMHDPEQIWITGQTFAYKNPKDPHEKGHRFYYAAQCRRGKDISLGKDMFGYIYWTQYWLSNQSDAWPTSGYSIGDSMEQIFTLLAQKEREEFENPALVPVPGLKGNYRDMATSLGVYFDDEGKAHAIDKNTRVTTGAAFNRESLDTIYSNKQPDQLQAEPNITTWADFHREIVGVWGKNVHTLEDMNTINYCLSPAHGRALFADMQKFQEIILNAQTSLQEKQCTITALKEFSAYGTNRSLLIDHFNIVILTTLLRTGEKVYSRFTASPGQFSNETIQLLSDIGAAITCFAQKKFKLSEQQAQQLADIILQGPDPYADKPLPLEAWLPAADAPKKPKRYSP